MTAASRNMKGVIKKFSKPDYDRNDRRGREALKPFLNKLTKLRTIDNPNKIGIDLLTLNSKDQVVACWEVEVREGNWLKDTLFPFSTINCIERKEYQWRKEQEFLDKIPFELHKDCKVFYVQMNNLVNRCVIIDSSIILKHKLIPWKNRKSEDEYVRQVPVSLCKQYKITGGSSIW